MTDPAPHHASYRAAIHRDRAHPSDGGKVRFMVSSGGYVMARRPRCAPFVMAEKKWLQLPFYEEPSA